MKQFSTISSAVLAIAVAVLFYLHFSSKKNEVKVATGNSSNSSFKVAYFELDSLQNQYNYFKDVIEQLNKKEQSIKGGLMQKKNELQAIYNKYQQDGKSMTQEQIAAASKDLENRQRELQIEEQTKSGEFGEETRNNLTKVKKSIEDYLKVFNVDKKYSIILSNASNNEIMYYKDSTFDITKDLVKGLNDDYKKTKKN